jgi:hypothetical protein
MSASPADARAQAEPPSLAPRGIACNGCAFNLAGLPRSGRCPECGTPIALSLAGGGIANDADDYVRTLRRGCSLLVVATAVRGASIVGTFGLLGALSSLNAAAMAKAPWLFDVFGVPSLLVTLWATWVFTTPHPRLALGERWWSARRVARWAMGCEFAFVLVRLILAQFGVLAQFTPGMSLSGYVQSSIAGLVYLGVQVSWLLGFFAILRYSGLVAARIPDDALRRGAARLQWLLPLLATVAVAIFMLGPAAALVLFGRHFQRLSRRIEQARAAPHAADAFSYHPAP